MKKYQQKPIPLIIRKNDLKYAANEEALDFFSSIKGKVAIISVAGMYRTGKSFLLNTMLLNVKNGFAVGPTINPKTKGIWVWGKPLNFKNEQNQIINVLVMDSEGLGSTEEDINHDLRLFSITLLLSSAFMYNSVGSIDENAIDSLGLVVKLCEHLKKESCIDFPDFYWIVRDFSLALVDKNGSPLTTKKYLQNCLSPQNGDSEVRNKIRNSIREAFPNRQCATFVRPLTDESCLQNLDKMNLDELRPEFVEQVIKFRKGIFKQLKTKTIKGKDVKGQMLCSLIGIYVDAINSSDNQGMPMIDSGWNYVCKKECEQAIEQVQKICQEKISHQMKENSPKCKKQLNEYKGKIYKQLEEQYLKKTINNEQSKGYLQKLNDIFNKKFRKFETQLKKKNVQEAQAFLKKEFQSIDKRMKQSQFKNMGELIKQFQVFYQYYRKKCPYKDEVQSGLEFIMKKFSDSSLIMYKSTTARKDAEIQALRQKMNIISTESSTKEQKHKMQKSQLHDKCAILESKLEDTQKHNISLNQQLKQLEQSMEQKVTQVQQSSALFRGEIQMENLRLKKKFLEIQNLYKQAEHERNQKLNRIEREILLKNNQTNHLLSQRQELQSKIKEMAKKIQTEKDEKALKFQQMAHQIEKERIQREIITKKLQNQIINKQNDVNKLQNHLQAKVDQINRLNKQITDKNRTMSEQKEQDLKRQIQSLKYEIECLKEKIANYESDQSLKQKKLQAEYSQKQMNIKMQSLQMQKQKAILVQKIEFIQRELDDKNERILKISGQNSYYLGIFQEKDNEISQLSSEIQELKSNSDLTSGEMVIKINALNEALLQRQNVISNLELQVQKKQVELRRKAEHINQINQQLSKSQTQKTKDLKLVKEENQKLHDLVEIQKRENQKQLDEIKQGYRKTMEEQKHSAEISLVQLKNFYEMERQRLQKRILQQRKKYQENQVATNEQILIKNKKIQKALKDQITQLKNKIQQLSEQYSKSQNQYQSKLMNLQQEKETQKRLFTNKNQSLQRKVQQVQQQLNSTEQQYQQERMVFIKKIESLNFQIGRKEKDLLQSISKKETAESQLAKKDLNLENTKKIMREEIQLSLQRVSEIQTKYQKLNEEYMQMKIQSEKEIALSKQRNEFLQTKLSELVKQKQLSQPKSFDKLDKQKISDLKQQLEKYKAEIMSMEAKLESNRKAMKELENNNRKDSMNLQKQNQFLSQKLQICEIKLSQITGKMGQKNQQYIKDLQQIRSKHQNQRNHLQNQLDILKQKLSEVDGERSEASWKLQKQLALLNDKIKFVEYQRDQAKKELQQAEVKLQLTVGQLKKIKQKTEDNQQKKSTLDKRLTNQFQVMKESMKVRTEEQEDQLKKMKQQQKSLKERNVELTEKLQKAERVKGIEKNLGEQVQNLRKQKQQLMNNHRSELSKENQEWKKKLVEMERKLKEVEKKNNQFLFTLEKEQAKWMMEKESANEKIKSLEQSLQYQKQKNNQIKNDIKGVPKKPGLYNSQLLK